MPENFYTILTSVGLAKLANAQVLGGTVALTTMKLGDSGGAYRNPGQADTDIVGEVWSGPISQISVDESNANWVVIETVIPAEVGDFHVREVGVYDDVGDLIAIGKYPETYKPDLGAGSGKDLYVRMILEVSNASSVELKIDPAIVVATRDYVDSEIAKIPPAVMTLTSKTIGDGTVFEGDALAELHAISLSL